MDTSSSAKETTSPVAGNSNIPGDNLKMDPIEEDSKLKENDVEETYQTDLNMLTIEDSTLVRIPPHLENLLQQFDVKSSQPAGLLVAIIYGMALECSIAAISEVQINIHRLDRRSYMSAFNVRNVMVLSKMPQNFYDPTQNVYTIRLQSIYDKFSTTCLLTGIVTGDFLILTLTPDCRDGGGKSICLSIERYVLNTKGTPFSSRFRKLRELSFKVREHLLFPIRKQLITKDGGVILYPTLDGLPDELYLYLYSFMNVNSLNKMANVSKRFRDTAQYYKKLKKNKLS